MRSYTISFYNKFRNLFRWRIWLGLLLSFITVSCSQEEEIRKIEILKIAILPYQNELYLQSRYMPLLDHIKSHTGLKTVLMIPKSYDELLHWYDSKQIDMALFGGATYVQAHLKSKAEPFVMRDADGSFRSVALVQASNPANSLRELKGASLAFGSRLSTSGHYMPRYFFQQKNINAEEFFSKILYSGAHDLTAEWVRDGKVELGVANSGIVNEMFNDGRISKDTVKVIWQSPPFSDNVWVLQQDINKQQKISIRDAFLHMSHDGEDKLLLEKLGTNYFIPASHNDFRNLEQVILQMQQRKVN